MYCGTTETPILVPRGVRVSRSRSSLGVGVCTILAPIILVLIAMSATSFAENKENAPDSPESSLTQIKKKTLRKTRTSPAQGKKKRPVKSAPTLPEATTTTAAKSAPPPAQAKSDKPPKSGTSLVRSKNKKTPVKFWTALAQGKTKTTTRKTEPTLADRVAKAKAEVAAAANDYKASLEKLRALQESDVRTASETVEKRKELLAQAIISKKELEESERALSAAQDKVANTKRQMAESDTLIAEATAEAELAKLGPGAYQATGAMIRYNGPAHWVLTDAAKVQGFFALRFNHALPISAFGQTAVHDHMGFDHHNAMDVAVSPDSSEGQALMAYLRSVGIPFIAFRYAVPGSATGAHIHIGYPSHRLSK
jgi:hypothetical protein